MPINAGKMRRSDASRGLSGFVSLGKEGVPIERIAAPPPPLSYVVFMWLATVVTGKSRCYWKGEKSV